jgi:hypothetical protein
MPANAGIQIQLQHFLRKRCASGFWTPAFARVTTRLAWEKE